MDIRDSVPLNEAPKEDAFVFLYNSQKELFDKYRSIEGMPDSFNINTPETQVWVKDFIHRVIEELFEFLEAAEEDDDNHKTDELSDALHFFVEIYVMLEEPKRLLLDGMIRNLEWVPLSIEDLERMIFEIIRNLEKASNVLKNRKWKKTQVLVDKEEFFMHLNAAFVLLIAITLNAFDKERSTKLSLLNLYHVKHQVNEFRIRSNY